MLSPQTSAMQVLLLEDDPAIARTICYALEREGIAVTHSLLIADARQQWSRTAFDVLLMDVGLPDGNGLDWCRELRSAGSIVPVLVLSARGEEMDKVLGLELGADDYLTKPFSPRELLARTRALLRRTTSSDPQQGAGSDQARISAAAEPGQRGRPYPEPRRLAGANLGAGQREHGPHGGYPHQDPARQTARAFARSGAHRHPPRSGL